MEIMTVAQEIMNGCLFALAGLSLDARQLTGHLYCRYHRWRRLLLYLPLPQSPQWPLHKCLNRV